MPAYFRKEVNMKPYKILVVSEGKTKWLELEGEGLERALEAMLQYLYDSINNLQDFEVWLCYPQYIIKTTFLEMITSFHIKKRDFYQRLQGLYTGKPINFELFKWGEKCDD